MAAITLCASAFSLPRYRYCLSPISSFTTAKLPSAWILRFIFSFVPYSVVMRSSVSCRFSFITFETCPVRVRRVPFRLRGISPARGKLYPLRKRCFFRGDSHRSFPSFRRKTHGKLEACSDDQASRTGLLSGCRSCSPNFLLHSVTIWFIQPLKKNLFLRGIACRAYVFYAGSRYKPTR